MRNLERFVIIFMFMLVELKLPAQDHLYSSPGMWIAKSEERQLVINTVFDSDFLGFPGYICYPFGNSDIKGFYIDAKSNRIVYTSFDIDFSKNGNHYRVKKYKRKSLDAGIQNIECLSDLLQLAVTTSIPLNGQTGNDGTMHYFIFQTDIAQSWSISPLSMQNKLVRICDLTCEACETENESLIESAIENIQSLISDYKKLLRFDTDLESFPWGSSLSIGSIFNSYLYVSAVFDWQIGIKHLQEYQKVMKSIARFLVENSEGPINCTIKVNSDLEETDDSVSDPNTIIVDAHGFTEENMLPICRDLLKKRVLNVGDYH